MGCEERNLTMDSFETIWSSTIEELSNSYRPGTFDFLEKYRPKLYEDINLAEDTLNRDWKKKWMVGFKIDVKRWRDLIKYGIEQFEREQMRLPEEKKLLKKSQVIKPKLKEAEPEAQRKKTFWQVFQTMQDREKAHDDSIP